MGPVPKQLPNPKQRNLKDFFLKYTQPIELPLDALKSPSPFAPFCAQQHTPLTVSTPREDIVDDPKGHPRGNSSKAEGCIGQQPLVEEGPVDIVADDENGISDIPRFIESPDQYYRSPIMISGTRKPLSPSWRSGATSARSPSPHSNRGASSPSSQEQETPKGALIAAVTPVTVRRIDPRGSPARQGDEVLAPESTPRRMSPLSPTSEEDDHSPNSSTGTPDPVVIDTVSSILQYDGTSDLNTASTTPPLTSSPLVRKRTRSSFAEGIESQHHFSTRPSKTIRSDPDEAHVHVPGCRRHSVELDDVDPKTFEALSPLPDQDHASAPHTSSQLSSLASRTPTPPPPVASQVLSFIASTQGSHKVIQSSQSDENEDLDDDLQDSAIAMADDSDGPAGASDSDSSLEDIATIIAKHKQMHSRLSQPVKSEPSLDPSTRSLRSQQGTGQSTPTALLSKSRPPMKTPTYQFSLANLLKHHERESSVKQELDRAKEALSEKKQVVTNFTSSTRGQVNEDVLMHAVKQEEGESNGIERLKHAMGRADVFQGISVWYFFTQNAHAVDMRPPAFPSLDSNSPLASLEDPVFREQAFQTGLVLDILAASEVPDAVISWLWHAGVWESRLHLAQTYIQALKAQLSQSKSELEQFYVEFAFEDMKIEPSGRQTNLDMKLVQHLRKAPAQECPHQFRHLVVTLGEMAVCLSTNAKAYSLEVLLRLGADELSHMNGEVMLTLSETVTSLADSLPQAEADDIMLNIAKSIYNALHDPILQCRLLASIPSISSRTHALKRRLALAFALRDPDVMSPTRSLTDPSHIVPSICATIERPIRAAKTAEFFDFRALAAEIAILDIGIDCGFSSRFPGPQETVPASSLDIEAASDLRAAEADFNATVDSMIKPVKALSRSIVDVGASHMAKTDAKAVVERLAARLEFAVRTRPKPKKGFLSDIGGNGRGGRAGEQNGNSQWMERWVTKRKEREKEKEQREQEIMVLDE